MFQTVFEQDKAQLFRTSFIVFVQDLLIENVKPNSFRRKNLIQPLETEIEWLRNPINLRKIVVLIRLRHFDNLRKVVDYVKNSRKLVLPE